MNMSIIIVTMNTSTRLWIHSNHVMSHFNVYQLTIVEVGLIFYLQIFHWFLKFEFGIVPIFFISVDRSTKIPPTFCGLDSRSNNYKVCCEKPGQPLPKPDPIKRFIPIHMYAHRLLILHILSKLWGFKLTYLCKMPLFT